jgi:hypothetical protein
MYEMRPAACYGLLQHRHYNICAYVLCCRQSKQLLCAGVPLVCYSQLQQLHHAVNAELLRAWQLQQQHHAICIIARPQLHSWKHNGTQTLW